MHTLLGQHNSYLHSKQVPLFPQVTVALGPHQSSLRQMETMTTGQNLRNSNGGVFNPSSYLYKTTPASNHQRTKS